MIYLDNAATTMRKPQEVIDAITAVMCSMGNAGRGVNEASLGAARTVYDTREKLAGFFGAEDARQIVFTMNSTESLNIAIKGILNPGDHVISTVLEHNSVLRPLYEMEKKGVEVTFLGCDEKGTLDYADFDKSNCLYPWVQSDGKQSGCGADRGNCQKTRSVVCGRCITDCRCISDRCAEDAY